MRRFIREESIFILGTIFVGALITVTGYAGAPAVPASVAEMPNAATPVVATTPVHTKTNVNAGATASVAPAVTPSIARHEREYDDD